MARVNVKQLSNNAIPSGAVVVSNGARAAWTSATTGAILLPSGTTAQQPTGVNGLLRHNSQLNRLEAYVNGSWQNVQAGSAAFTSLSDVPANYTGAGSQFVQVNAGATGLQFFAGMVVQRYAFTVTFSGGNPTVPVANAPTGWSFSINGTTGLNVDHNLGRQPIGCVTWGLTSTANLWTQRVYGVNSTFRMEYLDTNMNRTILQSLTATQTGAVGTGQARIELYFTAS